jgi:SPRY domain
MTGLTLALAACGGNVVVDGDGRSGGAGGAGSTGAANTSTGTATTGTATTGTAATGTGGSGGAGTTLNPNDKAEFIVLSNGNLSAASTIGSVNDSVRATTSKQTGKWYFEVTIQSAPDSYFSIGIADSQELLELSPGSSSFGCGYHYDGVIACDASYQLYVAPYYGGDVIGVAADFDARLLYFTLNGEWVLGEPQYVNGLEIGEVAMFPMVNLSEDDFLTVNFGASPFVYAVPSGFQAGW